MQKASAPNSPLLSYSEQVRGEMSLKAWETNLGEVKKLSIEVKEAFLKALSSLKKN
jgi:hypothetical protein